MDIKIIKNKKITYLALILVAGVMLILGSGAYTKDNSQPLKETVQSNVPNAETVEKKLEKIIGTVAGISDVSVFVTYNNTGKKNLAVVSEDSVLNDGEKHNSTSKTQAVTTKGKSGEEPFVKEELLPEIRGVIICAKGVGDEETRLMIADAVSSAMDVPLHRVRVLSKD